MTTRPNRAQKAIVQGKRAGPPTPDVLPRGRGAVEVIGFSGDVNLCHAADVDGVVEVAVLVLASGRVECVLGEQLPPVCGDLCACGCLRVRVSVREVLGI